MPTKIRSTVLLAQDLGRATRFYDGLELKTIGRFDEHGLAIVDAGGSQLWLFTGLPDVKKAAYPLCVLSVDDLEAARERVEEHGGRVVSELTKDGLGAHYIVQDTEGNTLEIRQPPRG